MAKLQFLTILLTVTCFQGSVVSITDMEIEDRFNRMDQQLQQLRDENSVMMERIERQDMLIQEQNSRQDGCVAEGDQKLIQNMTIEERVTILETRVMEIEEDIQGLQMTHVELDERVSALEENGGDGNSMNDTIAFHTVLTFYSSIPYGSAVLFDEVLLNEGDGYDSTTGTFTVPSGGGGLYYFSVYLPKASSEYANFDLEVNGECLCSSFDDLDNANSGDWWVSSCSGVTEVVEGDVVQVVYIVGTDDTLLLDATTYHVDGFTGFRI